jgi:hypothetical protein
LGTREACMAAGGNVVVSMLTGARTDEMRELTWDQMVLEERALHRTHIPTPRLASNARTFCGVPRPGTVPLRAARCPV